MPYSLLATSRAQRELDDLPSPIAQGLRRLLHAICAEPRSRRFDIKQLRLGRPDRPLHRLRVGDYRIIFEFRHGDQELVVVRVGRRDRVYRGLPGIGD